MNYSVLLEDIKHPCSGGTLTLKACGVYELCSSANGVRYRSIDTLGFGDALDTYGEPYGPWYEMSLSDSVRLFTPPQESLDSVITDSFLIWDEKHGVTA